MTRPQIHISFAEAFVAGDSLPFSQGDIAKIETELQVTFPSSYLEFACRYGSIYTPSLLDLVTGGESEIAPEGASWDIRHFLTPTEIVETSRMYWSGGMDDWLVAIADDCMGNVFGFRRTTNLARPEESPLYLFDHDFCKIEEEAQGFDAWLESFLKMKAK